MNNICFFLAVLQKNFLEMIINNKTFQKNSEKKDKEFENREILKVSENESKKEK